MKCIPTLVLVAVICLPGECEAQFRLKFPGGGGNRSGEQFFGGQRGGQFFDGVGRIVKDQIRSEVQNQGERILGEIDKVIGGGHHTMPFPQPVVPRPVTPVVTPMPYPIPSPQPHPGPVTNPDGGGCRIVPQPYPPVNELPYAEQGEPIASEMDEPAELAVPLPMIESGQIVTLEDSTFGEDVGAVFVKIDSLILTADLLEWTDTMVKVRMPHLPMLVAAEAQVVVLSSEGEIAEAIAIEFSPSTQSQVADAEAEVEEDMELPVVYTGQEVSINGEFGETEGVVELHIGQLILAARIIEWSVEETTFQIPELNLDEPTAGSIVVNSREGELVEQLEIAIYPADAANEVVVSDQ